MSLILSPEARIDLKVVVEEWLMFCRRMSWLPLSALAALLLVVPTDLKAAEFTDLLDAADDFDDNDPETFKAWDFHLEPSFRFDFTTANVTREAPCVPNQPTRELERNNPRLVVSPDRCDEPRIVDNQEMAYESSRSTLDIALRAGLYKDLELRVTIPYVLSSTRSLRYGDGVGATNSSVDPSDDRIRRHAEDVFQPGMSSGAYVTRLDQFQLFRFFDLSDENRTYERSGWGDPTVGIHWAPWNDYRDDTKATMLIGMDYTMPLAEVQRAGNRGVGRGVHELEWKLAASKKFGWFEPYFGAQYSLPLPATDSLYGRVDRTQNQGQGQVLLNPPQRAEFTVGTEIIAFEDPERHIRHAFDLRFQFGYVSEGRDYTALFDHMTDPRNDCNGLTIQDVQPQFNADGTLRNPEQVACSWVIRQPSNAGGRNTAIYTLDEAIDRNDQTEFAFTDLMSVDSYGTFGGQLGIYLQPSRFFQFRGVVGLTSHQTHMITNARTGRNSIFTTEDSVSMTDARERNPAYNPSYDNSGNRFKVKRHNTWHFGVTTALQF